MELAFINQEGCYTKVTGNIDAVLLQLTFVHFVIFVFEVSGYAPHIYPDDNFITILLSVCDYYSIAVHVPLQTQIPVRAALKFRPR